MSIAIERQSVSTRRSGSSTGQRRLNDVIAIALLIIAALAPLPLGSNRPFFWALWAALIGLVAVLYLGALVLRGEALRVPLRRYWLPAGLFALVLGMLGAQLVPGLLPASFLSAAGDTITAASGSLAPGSTWLMGLQLASYGLYFFLMLQVSANRGRARLLLSGLFIIIVLHALYGLVALTMLGDVLLFFPKWAYEGFATGGFVNRNSFATFLAFGLVLGVLLALRELRDGLTRQPGNALLYLCGTALVLAALVATGSRMGLLAGLGGAGLGALLASGKGEGGRLRPRTLVLALLVLAAGLGVVLLYGASTLERLGSVESDATVRGELYQQVWAMILMRPWVGYGGGAFEAAYPLFHALPVSPDLVWDKAHSTYLALWAELGLIAGSIPLVILALLGVEAMGLYRRRRADWTAPAAVLGVMVVAALHSLVDFSLEIEANALIFLAIIAVGLGRQSDRSDAPPAG